MKLFNYVLAGILVFIFFAIGFFMLDFVRGAKPNVRKLQRVAGLERQPDIPPSLVFAEHYQIIHSRYKDSKTSEELREAAMSGLVASLGDPHTNFLSPKITKAFTTETQGNYSGIGARLSDDPLGARIAVVFKGGPAEEAGLKPGDVITQVDDYNASGKPVDEIVQQILGEEGTPVELSIVREGIPGIKPMRIIRRQILIPTVEHKMVANSSIAYIRVTGFSQPTAGQFREALIDSLQDNANGMIIDMRANPGGLVDAAVDMLSFFIADKPVVSMKPREGRPVTAATRSDEVLVSNMPIVILVDEGSASAAEIFAGAMRDYRLAVLVGTHTFGKASVQQLYGLPAGASAKITIARYFLPSTGDIERKVDEEGEYVSGGLAPDVKVELDPTGNYEFGEPGKDPQLDRAINYLIHGG